MYLKSIELTGFKSFGRKTELVFGSRIAAIVGPNGSGKSNTAEGFRFVLGEQSMKAMRGKRGEDMIWGGSPTFPRAGRAAVKVVFDNTPVNGVRLLDVDFPEVVVERVVHRDGLNEYLLNGTQVRLKDVIRLLAGANIGGSGYQIISQGEADRILNASPKERREMVEDALGLKLFQHKKHESERKLEETANNIEKTRSLRREIGPHLNFLRQQVEKIEKARELKDEGHDAIAIQALQIADDKSGDPQRDKLRIETRLKLLAKWNPKKYGDSTQIKHADADGNKLDTAPLVNELLSAMGGASNAPLTLINVTPGQTSEASSGYKPPEERIKLRRAPVVRAAASDVDDLV
jgi:chromosome segregation ATPase